MGHKPHDKQNTSHADEPENTPRDKGPTAEKGDARRDEHNHHTGKTRNKGSTHQKTGSQTNPEHKD